MYKGMIYGDKDWRKHGKICLESMYLFRVFMFIQEITQCEKLKFNLTMRYHALME